VLRFGAGYSLHPDTPSLFAEILRMMNDYVGEFRSSFKIDSAVSLGEVAPLIEAIYEVQQEARAAIWRSDWNSPAVGFRAQALFNLLTRTYEHARAMLVANVTGSPASSEVLGRTVIEGAINVIYLAEKGNPGMLLNFLHSWVSEHSKKLNDWARLVAETAPAEALDRINVRQGLVRALAKYLEGAEAHCELSAERSSSPWPKQLPLRFQALGREDAYYECYHRLSGACHITGEDTISYLISQDMSHDVQVSIERCA